MTREWTLASSAGPDELCALSTLDALPSRP